MLTRTTKTIRVTYSKPALACVRRLRVLPPAQRGNQKIIEARWNCIPEADGANETSDDFGNRVLELRHRRIESEFCFEASFVSSRVSLDAGREENIPPNGIGALLLPSRLCDWTPQIAHIADEIAQSLKSTPTFGRTFSLAQTFCNWTHAALIYTPRETEVGTTASQVLAHGRGVCQDFAHLMIALCRAQNIPARYVSGSNCGEGAMHAWVEVLCDEQWIAFDPTHNRRTRSDCVFVATGRDFRDVSPMIARYSGGATAHLETQCQTVPVFETQDRIG